MPERKHSVPSEDARTEKFLISSEQSRLIECLYLGHNFANFMMNRLAGGEEISKILNGNSKISSRCGVFRIHRHDALAHFASYSHLLAKKKFTQTSSRLNCVIFFHQFKINLFFTPNFIRAARRQLFSRFSSTFLPFS